MKPVTEDQVVSLLRNLEEREKAALKDLAADVASGRFGAGRMTARVLSFSPSRRQAVEDRQSEGEVVSIADARDAASARRTVRGIFVYSTNAPEPA